MTVRQADIQASVTSTDPGTYPITTAQAKEHARITSTAEDTLVDLYITAATRTAEMFTGRAFISQTVVLTLDRFPTKHINLPRPPLVSVASLKYYDENDTQQTWSASNYQVDSDSEPGRVRPVSTQSWPGLYDRMNAVEVTYTAGYGAAADVPEEIKLGIKYLVAHFYQERDPVIKEMLANVPMTVDALLTPYQVDWLG